MKEVREQQAKFDPPEPPALFSWTTKAFLVLLFITTGVVIGAFVSAKILITGGFCLLGLLYTMNKMTNGISNRTIETYAFSFKIITCYVLTRFSAREYVVRTDFISSFFWSQWTFLRIPMDKRSLYV